MLLLSFLVACSGGAGDTAGELVGDATSGETLYASNCSSCHGTDGVGGTGPALADISAEYADDADIAHVIEEGTDAGMPPFTSLSEQDIADIIAYIRTF